MQQLPKNFVLQTKFNNKYLSFIASDEGSYEVQLILKDCYDSDPNSIFETEVSSVGDGLFVSIKSSFNNKYLVITKFENNGGGDLVISPTADVINEDESSESCTLFKPCFVGENNEVRFYHAHHKKYLSFSVTFSRLFLPLLLNDGEDQLFDLFTFTEVEPLPPTGKGLYAFKGDNGKYLTVVLNGLHDGRITPYLKFVAPNTEIPEVWFECDLSKSNDHSMRTTVKSISVNGYWNFDRSKWILVRKDASMPNELFEFDWENSAFKINGMYCQRHEDESGSNMADFFIANTSTVTKQAKLKPERRKGEEGDPQISSCSSFGHVL